MRVVVAVGSIALIGLAAAESMKGVLTVRVTSAGERPVMVTAVVRNGYADTSRSVIGSFFDWVSPSVHADLQKIKRMVPIQAVTVRTPAEFYIYPHLASLEVRVAGSSDTVVTRVTGWRGFTPLSARGRAIDVRTRDGRASISTIAGK